MSYPDCLVCFVKICRNLITVHANWMSHALPQGIRTIKYFTKYKNVLLLVNLSQKSAKTASNNVEITVAKWKQLIIKSKIPSINYPYFDKIFNFFIVNLTSLRKLSDILLLGVTNTPLLLRFIKSNKFYYTQTAKLVNSKYVSC